MKKVSFLVGLLIDIIKKSLQVICKYASVRIDIGDTFIIN